MTEQNQATPNKSHLSTSSYLGSTQKRTQSPFARRTWDLNGRVSSPFRRLADTNRRPSSLPLPLSSEARQRQKTQEVKTDEIMDWIDSIKQRAQLVLKTEEDEEKRFYEELEKEKRQIEAQNQINTESFDKLRLYLDKQESTSKSQQPPVEGADKSSKGKLTGVVTSAVKDRNSITIDESDNDEESYSDEEGALGIPEQDTLDEHLLEEEGEEEDDEAEEEEDEAIDQDDYDQDDYDEDDDDQEQDDDDYDSEGRLKFPDDSDLINLSSQEESEEPSPQYDPSDFTENEKLEYNPTPQYESMYSGQRYVPKNQNKTHVLGEEKKEEVVELSDSEENNQIDNYDELDEDQLSYESEQFDEQEPEEDEEESDNLSDQSQFNDKELYGDEEHRDFEDDAEEESENEEEEQSVSEHSQHEYGYSNLDPSLFNDSDDNQAVDTYEISVENNVTETFSNDEVEKDGEAEDAKSAETNSDVELEVSQAMQQDDLSQFELLASAALTQLSGKFVGDQANELDDHVDLQEQSDFEETPENRFGKSDKNLEELGYEGATALGTVISADEGEELEENGNSQLAKAKDASHLEAGQPDDVAERKNEQEQDKEEEDDEGKEERVHSSNESEEVEPVQEYSEEQYYDSDNEPFRSPSHSLFGSLTVDEISAIQDEGDDSDDDMGFYSTNNILGDIEENHETPEEAENVCEKNTYESSNELKTPELTKPSSKVHFDTERLNRDNQKDDLHNNEGVKSFVSFFDTKPHGTQSPNQSFSEVSEQFTKALESKKPAALEVVSNKSKVSKGNAYEHEHFDKISATDLKKDKKVPDNNLRLASLSETKKASDSMLATSLGELPETFIERTKSAQEDVADIVNNVRESHEEDVSQGLSRSPLEAVEDILTNIGDVVSSNTKAMKKEADQVLERSIGEDATGFVDDIENAASSIKTTVLGAVKHEDDVFAKSIGEIGEEFVVDTKATIENIAVPTKPSEDAVNEADQSIYHDSHDQTLNDTVGPETVEVVEEETPSANHTFKEHAEVSDTTNHRSVVDTKEKNNSKKKTGKLDEDTEEDTNRRESENIDSKKTEFEIPDIVRNAMFKAIRTAEKIEELGEAFVDDESKPKPQTKPSIFNRGFVKPFNGSAKATQESSEGETGNLTTETVPNLDIQQYEQFDGEQKDISRKRKLDDDDSGVSEGIFTKVKRFARFVGRELNNSLDSPISEDSSSDKGQAVNKTNDKKRGEDHGYDVENEENETFPSFIQEGSRGKSEDGSLGNSVKAKFSEVAQTVENFKEVVEEKVEEAFDSQIDDEIKVDAINTSIGELVSETMKEATHFGEFVEEQVEEAFENTVEETPASDVASLNVESHVVSETMREAANFAEFVEEQVEEAFENTVEETPDPYIAPLNVQAHEKSTETSDGSALDEVEDVIFDVIHKLEEKVEEAVEDPVAEEETSSIDSKKDDASNKSVAQEGESTGQTNIVEQAIENVEEFGKFVEEAVEEAVDEPVNSVTGSVHEGEESNTSVLDNVSETVHDFGQFVEDKVEEAIENPVSHTDPLVEDDMDVSEDSGHLQAEDPSDFNEDKGNEGIRDSIPRGTDMSVLKTGREEKNVEYSKPDESRQHDDRGYVLNEVNRKDIEDHSTYDNVSTAQGESGPHQMVSDIAGNKTGTSQEVENRKSEEGLQKTVLDPGQPEPKNYKSPLKKVFDYFFTSSKSTRTNDEVQNKSNDSEGLHSVERPSKRRKKASPAADFHGHIVMRTRSGKIIGANSEDDIAEAQGIENEEEELIDRIAHGEIHTGHVLHDLALEHERIDEHEVEQEEPTGTRKIANATKTESGELVESETSVPLKGQLKQGKQDDEIKDEPEEVIEEENVEHEASTLKKKERGTKRSRTESDASGEIQKADLKAANKKTAKGRQKKELPPPSERKLRSRTK